MPLSFRTLALFTAFLCFSLALIWGFTPESMLSIWNVGYSDTTGLMARRGAMLFMALGVMFYLARNAPPSAARAAMSNGLMVGVFGLAVLGFAEWLNGRAGPGILLAVLLEIALGLAFFKTRRTALALVESAD